MTRQEFQNQLTTLPLTPDGVWSADADLIADFNNGNNLQIRYNNESLSWTIIDRIMWVEGASLRDAIEQWETYADWGNMIDENKAIIYTITPALGVYVGSIAAQVACGVADPGPPYKDVNTELTPVGGLTALAALTVSCVIWYCIISTIIRGVRHALQPVQRTSTRVPQVFWIDDYQDSYRITDEEYSWCGPPHSTLPFIMYDRYLREYRIIEKDISESRVLRTLEPGGYGCDD